MPAKKVDQPEFPKTVFSTIQPNVALLVDEAEYTDLKHQGLLYEGPHPDDEGAKPRTQKED